MLCRRLSLCMLMPWLLAPADGSGSVVTDLELLETDIMQLQEEDEDMSIVSKIPPIGGGASTALYYTEFVGAVALGSMFPLPAIALTCGMAVHELAVEVAAQRHKYAQQLGDYGDAVGSEAMQDIVKSALKGTDLAKPMAQEQIAKEGLDTLISSSVPKKGAGRYKLAEQYIPVYEDLWELRWGMWKKIFKALAKNSKDEKNKAEMKYGSADGFHGIQLADYLDDNDKKTIAEKCPSQWQKMQQVDGLFDLVMQKIYDLLHDTNSARNAAQQWSKTNKCDEQRNVDCVLKVHRHNFVKKQVGKRLKAEKQSPNVVIRSLKTVLQESKANVGSIHILLEIWMGESIANWGVARSIKGLLGLSASVTKLNACEYFYKGKQVLGHYAVSSVGYYLSSWDSVCDAVLEGLMPTNSTKMK